MSPDVFIPAIATGILGGAALLLPTLAVAILYQHGRYIPLWLPDLGLIGAYTVHALWTRGVPGAVAAVIAFGLATILAWIIHRTLIVRFLSAKDYLSPLLVGLGVSQMFQAVTSFYGEGMSQHYPRSVWANQFYSAALGTSLYWVDIAFVALTVVSLAGLYAYLHHTNWGTKVRMVIANPDDARKLALPVRTIDAIVLAAAAIVVTAGTLMRGLRFDLQPSMMFYPGLSAIAACIVAAPSGTAQTGIRVVKSSRRTMPARQVQRVDNKLGYLQRILKDVRDKLFQREGQLLLTLFVVVTIEIVGSLIGTMPAVAQLQRAVPFAVLLSALVIRQVIWPKVKPFLRRGTPPESAIVPTQEGTL